MRTIDVCPRCGGTVFMRAKIGQVDLIGLWFVLCLNERCQWWTPVDANGSPCGTGSASVQAKQTTEQPPRLRGDIGILARQKLVETASYVVRTLSSEAAQHRRKIRLGIHTPYDSNMLEQLQKEIARWQEIRARADGEVDHQEDVLNRVDG